MNGTQNTSPWSDKTLLIVQNDKFFASRLSREMESRGFQVKLADTVENGLAKISSDPPAHAIIDSRLDDGNGLTILTYLKTVRQDSRAIIVTSYDSLANAVTAIKLGAVDYLAKPTNADNIYTAMTSSLIRNVELPENPMSANRVRWEHIQRVYEACNRNVSETARRLRMHRRTLQRILSKHAPR